MTTSKKDVKRLVQTLIDSNARIPDMAELSSLIVDQMGGVKGLAVKWYTAYNAATPGIQAKMLDNFVLTLRHVSEKGDKTKNLKNLDQDQLESLVGEILERRVGKAKVEEGPQA